MSVDVLNGAPGQENVPGDEEVLDLDVLFPNVDPFLLHKWEHAFLTFFDVNRNGTLEWEDFQELIEIIGGCRGQKSDEYITAKLALTDIWHRLTEAVHIPKEGKITLQDWIRMWESSLNGTPPAWQQFYLDYMFNLFDASGDRLIDQSEYIQVLGYFGIDREEAVTAFDKFAKNEEGQCVMAIDEKKFLELWDQYFHSSDMDVVGNYLLGYI